MSNTKELAKSFEPAGIEERWYPVWEQRGYFDAGLDPSKPSFSIQLPPPNITGILHMGHAFNQTVMDSLTRYYRMSGYNTMWLPGTDHAGIATQIVVERLLQKEGKDKRDIGRNAFVERIWEWQKFSGGTILNQMRRLGDSLDWKRLYFTMNDKLSAVVRETFVQLYNEGLIYKGLRLVNWDPKLQSAVSDLEVESEEENGHMWEIRYRPWMVPKASWLPPNPSGKHSSAIRPLLFTRRRTLQATWWARCSSCRSRPRNSRHRRRVCRQGFRFGLREDHAGSRL